ASAPFHTSTTSVAGSNRLELLAKIDSGPCRAMGEPPFSGPFACIIPAPCFRGCATGELEHLDHCAVGERLHDGAGGWLDSRGRLTHFHPGDSLDLLPQPLGG